jgi:acetylornithine deacetylase/succinyl-diaminopimelate desuccinylase-like protein
MMKGFFFSFLLAAAVPLSAQEQYPSKFIPELAERPTVRAALQYIDEHFDYQVQEWIRITEIPSPSRHEAERGAYVRAQFEALGLETATDSIGNVTGLLRGTAGSPTLIMAGHMDTVHPLGTDVTVTRRDGKLFAPGVTDASGAVAAVLATARALVESKVPLKGDVLFMGTVQEELGLVGMKYWFDHNPAPDMLVEMDGMLGPVAYGALGVHWVEMIFRAQGAHTVYSRGQPHPAKAASRCILDTYTIPLPSPDEVSFFESPVYNVGRISGPSVPNAIPREVSFTLDLRTVDPDVLTVMDSTVTAMCEAAARSEEVEFEKRYVMRLEAGGTREDLEWVRGHPIVQTAVDVLSHLGYDFGEQEPARAFGSTDANVGILHGVPSVAIGRSISGGAHTLDEWSDIESTRIGTKQMLLLTIALAELAEMVP